MNISIEEASKIEKDFKELHKGLYTWGTNNYNKFTKSGYIVSALGFRLKLPMFDKYLYLEDKVKNLTKEDWTKYRLGKQIKLDVEEKKLELSKLNLNDLSDFNFYKKHASDVGEYFSLKGRYMRLSLNSPVQTIGAHQIKAAAVDLFDYIENRNDYWKVKICALIHDETLLEVVDELAVIYKTITENCMVDAGNKFMINGLKMKASAEIATSWSDK